MSKSQQSFNKKEKEKNRRKKRQDKEDRREQRKAEKAARGATSFEDMISYVDENGNITKKPPDPAKKIVVKAEDIVLGVPPRDTTPDDPIRTGLVKFFNDDKGYGFITDSLTKDGIFVHANNLTEPIRENDRVTFEIEMGPKGPNAVNVKIIA